jgi:hypothetical protein
MTTARTAGLAGMVLLAAASAAPALAQTGMGLIGQRVVDGADRDTIAARGSGQYREMMICVEDAPVAFQEVVVQYKSGGAQHIRLRQRIAAGRCSRIVTLSGRDRDIATVDFTYAPAAGGASSRPRVQLYAR